MDQLPEPLAGLARPLLSPLARLLFRRGWAHMRRSRPARAYRAFARAGRVAHLVGAAVVEAHAMTGLGVVFAVAGAAPDHLETAQRLHEEALALFRKVDNWFGQGVALGNLANVYEETGQNERALDAYRRAASLHRAAGARAGEAEAWTGVALTYVALGAPAQARATLEEKVVAFSAELGRPDMPARILARLSASHWQAGENEAAYTCLEQALELFQQAGDWASQTYTLRDMGVVRARMGQAEDAARLLRRALQACDHQPVRYEEVNILHELAMTLYGGLGQREEAIRVLAAAIARLQHYGLPGPPVRVSLKQMRDELSLMRAGEPLTPAGEEPLSAPSAEA